ncbi:chemotaxis protein CheA [Acetobacter musti]
MMDDLDSIRPIFFEECAEQLTELERALARLENGEADHDTVNAAFRAVHSIKGGAGSFGMTELVRFAHIFETALDLLRSGKITPAPSVLQIFLHATDVLSDLTAAEQGGPAADPQRTEECGKMLEALSAMPEAEPAQKSEDPAEATPEADDGVPDGFMPVRFEFEEDLSDPQNIPELSEGFEIFSDSPASGNMPHAEAEPPAEMAKSVRSESPCETKTPVLSGPVSKAPVVPVTAPPASIRVDVARIDRVMDLVGELVIGQSALREAFDKNALSIPGESDSSTLSDAMNAIGQLTRDIQDAVMAVRAQPLRTVFQRMQRVVRETSLIAKKRVHLITEGEDTEVDRTLIERLTDPLTHMLRNAIDHGIEPEEKRIAAGKPAEGTITLSAAHRSGRIVITIKDDGGGINRERVRAIAEKKGIISPDANLSDADVDNLIFAPGFSTSETVTDLSGRGVGMDVVKQAIQDLGGRVSIQSEAGKGSDFILSLPLTLAVMDGMLVTAAGQVLILPVSCIVETMMIDRKNIFPVADDMPLMCVRGSFIPMIEIGSALGFSSVSKNWSDKVVLIVEDDDGRTTALVADSIDGQMQIVIKAIETNYRPIAGVSAATILGSGQVALILDVPAVIAGAGKPADISWVKQTGIPSEMAAAESMI